VSAGAKRNRQIHKIARSVYNKKYKQEHKKELSDYQKRYLEKYPKHIINIRLSPRYNQWRSDVFQRDNWTCQTCGIRGYNLEAHHSMVGFTKLLKTNNINTYDDALKCEALWELDNGVTLCEDCHKLINWRST
jgi:5-methylcytosine-specific restriction endonuclease McrA